jgi:hypothetical protein
VESKRSSLERKSNEKTLKKNWLISFTRGLYLYKNFEEAVYNTYQYFFQMRRRKSNEIDIKVKLP